MSTAVRTRLINVATALIGAVLGAVVWQALGERNPVLLSTPGESWDAIVRLARSGALWGAFLESMQIYSLGLAAAVGFGVLYGLAIARSRWLRDGTEWLVYAFQAVPVVALTPFILAGIGFGVGAKALVVFLVAVFPVLISTAEGAKNVPATLVDVTKVYRSSERRFWSDLLIPHSVGYVMTGVRQSVAIAFVGTVAAEFFLNPTGLGGMLLLAGMRFASAEVLALTVTLALLAGVFVQLGHVLERTVVRWRRGGL